MKRIGTILFTLLFFVTSAVFADLGPNHKKRQARPVKCGTSGGNVTDFVTQPPFVICCSGTLGAVVKDASNKLYVLSNNHVLAKSNAGHIGDKISQPGNIDVNCSPSSTDTVATLSKFAKITFSTSANNKVDGAIAAIVPGDVSTSGAIIDVGNPGQPQAAALNMHVKKSGRTTGLRKGIITALNLTTITQYDTSCGSSTHKSARFVGQIYVSDAAGGTPNPFIDHGDSGSLLVADVASCPAALGLLFAGDSTGGGAANPIQTVLSALGNVKIVGCGTAAPVGPTEASDALTMAHPAMIAAAAIQRRHEDELLQIPGVTGVGIGLADPNSKDLAIVVFTEKGSRAAETPSALPSKLDNLPVRRIVAGPFVAY